MLKKQQGFGLAEVTITLIILGIVAISGMGYKYNIQIPEQEANKAATFMDTATKSSMAYFMDNRQWPSSLNQLKNSQNYFGELVSNYGTTLNFSENNGLLSISLNTITKSNAARLVHQLKSRGVSTIDMNNSVVSLYLAEPTENSIQSYFLARREVPGCPSCNTLETDIDANGYNLEQVKKLSGDRAEFTDGSIQNALIDNLTTKSIRMAGVTLSASGQRLTVNADEVNISGDVNGRNGSFNRVNADTVSGKQFYGDNFTTPETSLLETKQQLDEVLQQWNLCETEGNCKS